jgi:hypothetical protein
MQDWWCAYGNNIDIVSIEQAAIVASGEWNGILPGCLLQLSFVDIGDRSQPSAACKRIAGYSMLLKDFSRTDNSDSHNIHMVPLREISS